MHGPAATPASAAAATSPHDYDYALPAELIAQLPAAEREAARLLVLERSSGAVRHAVVRELPRLLQAGDLLVFNDARVSPARLRCRTASGGAVELLLLSERTPADWICLGRPAKRLRPGTELLLAGGAAATVAERLGA